MQKTLLRSILAWMMVVLLPLTVWSYRDHLSPEQKAQLEKIQTLRIDVIALTDKGAGDAGPLADIVARRMAALGYSVVQEAGKPYDAVLKIK